MINLGGLIIIFIEWINCRIPEKSPLNVVELTSKSAILNKSREEAPRIRFIKKSRSFGLLLLNNNILIKSDSNGEISFENIKGGLNRNSIIAAFGNIPGYLFKTEKSSVDNNAVVFKKNNLCFNTFTNNKVEMGECNSTESQFYIEKAKLNKKKKVKAKQTGQTAELQNINSIKNDLINFLGEVKEEIPEIVKEEVERQNSEIQNKLYENTANQTPLENAKMGQPGDMVLVPKATLQEITGKLEKAYSFINQQQNTRPNPHIPGHMHNTVQSPEQTRLMTEAGSILMKSEDAKTRAAGFKILAETLKHQEGNPEALAMSALLSVLAETIDENKENPKQKEEHIKQFVEQMMLKDKIAKLEIDNQIQKSKKDTKKPEGEKKKKGGLGGFLGSLIPPTPMSLAANAAANAAEDGLGD